jgi:hypothetical protein
VVRASNDFNQTIKYEIKTDRRQIPQKQQGEPMFEQTLRQFRSLDRGDKAMNFTKNLKYINSSQLQNKRREKYQNSSMSSTLKRTALVSGAKSSNVIPQTAISGSRVTKK